MPVAFPHPARPPRAVKFASPQAFLPGTLLALLLLIASLGTARAQDPTPSPQPTPDSSQSPAPQTPEPPTSTPETQPFPARPQGGPPPAPDPCEVKNAGGSMAATAAARAATVVNANSSEIPNTQIVNAVLCVPHMPMINWYARFLNGPQVKQLTPLEKAHLAGRNLVDPFNILTIMAASGFSVATNSHSVYGPGLFGWSKNVGVSFTQDMVGEFFGTFLIPSIAHQDPHYHRMPGAPIKHRILHAAGQIFWTQGDNGNGMFNYADVVGFAFDDGANDLYVPGQKTNLHASAARYGTALATAPLDNFITEFLPDIASHIHIRIVLVQRFINQVARTNNVAQ